VFLDSFGELVQQLRGVMDLAQYLLAVLWWDFGLIQSALRQGCDLVQIVVQSDGCWLLPLLLHFQKHFRRGKNALAQCAFGITPSVVECGGLPRGPGLPGEYRRHLEALLETHSRHRHEVSHGDLGCDLTFTHLLLDRLR
jgi:hypothetical protein